MGSAVSLGSNSGQSSHLQHKSKQAKGLLVAIAVCDSPSSHAAFAWLRANVLRRQDHVSLVHVHPRSVGREQARSSVSRFEELCVAHSIQYRMVIAEGSSVLHAVAQQTSHAHLAVIGCRALGSQTHTLRSSVRFQPHILSLSSSSQFTRMMFMHATHTHTQAHTHQHPPTHRHTRTHTDEFQACCQKCMSSHDHQTSSGNGWCLPTRYDYY